MDVTQALPIIDKASTASFQWLFVAILALLLVFVYAAFRHLIQQGVDMAKQAREDSKGFQAILQDYNQKAMERGERHAAVISENTTVISQAKQVMDRINSTLCKV